MRFPGCGQAAERIEHVLHALSRVTKSEESAECIETVRRGCRKAITSRSPPCISFSLSPARDQMAVVTGVHLDRRLSILSSLPSES